MKTILGELCGKSFIFSDKNHKDIAKIYESPVVPSFDSKKIISLKEIIRARIKNRFPKRI